MRNFLLFAVLLLLAFGLASCTEMERRGVSSIPQNRPASWENNPFAR